MELRWLVKQYPKPSVAQVREYRDQNCMGMVEAKNALLRRDVKSLQYRDSSTEWVDVPTVYEPGDTNE